MSILAGLAPETGDIVCTTMQRLAPTAHRLRIVPANGIVLAFGAMLSLIGMTASLMVRL